MLKRLLTSAFLLALWSTDILPQASLQQKADSVLSNYIHLRETAEKGNTQAAVHGKCGFGASMAAHLSIAHASPAMLQKAKNVLDRPTTETSVVSPSGFFRVHYNRTSSVPQYDVAELCRALDSSYAFEVGFLGFPAPPADGTNGGDSKYDIYVVPTNPDYGSTVPDYEVTPGSQTYTSYMMINNDFSTYPTKGIDAARVTAAHEFHHSIQMGNYIFRSQNSEIVDQFFYELTSTCMEKFVFPGIHDYINYLDNFFNSPSVPFAEHQGYDLGIWNLFLQKKYGYGFIKKQWDLLKSTRAMNAIALSLVDEGTTFLTEYATFATECFYTGYRAHYRLGSTVYFEDAGLFPVYSLVNRATLSSRSTSMMLNVYPTSINILTVVNRQSGLNDTLHIFVTNGDVKSGIDALATTKPVTYQVSLDPLNGTQQVGDYYVNISMDDKSFSQSGFFLNNVQTDGTLNIARDKPDVFPNPFVIKQSMSSCIYFRLKPNDADETVDLSVYDISMNRVFSGKQTVMTIGKPLIKWDLSTENPGGKLASGVYIYHIKSKLNEITGKLVIINK